MSAAIATTVLAFIDVPSLRSGIVSEDVITSCHLFRPANSIHQGWRIHAHRLFAFHRLVLPGVHRGGNRDGLEVRFSRFFCRASVVFDALDRGATVRSCGTTGPTDF